MLIWISEGPLHHPRLQRSESSDLSPLRWQRITVKLFTAMLLLHCIQQPWLYPSFPAYLSVQWHLCSDRSGGIDGKQLLVVDKPIMNLTACPQIWVCSLNIDTHRHASNWTGWQKVARNSSDCLCISSLIKLNGCVNEEWSGKTLNLFQSCYIYFLNKEKYLQYSGNGL